MDPEVVLQTVGGVLVTISLGLAGWALHSVVELGKQHAALMAQVQANKESANEKILDARNNLDRRISDVRESQSSEYADLKADLREVKTSITAVHRRIDEMSDKKGSA